MHTFQRKPGFKRYESGSCAKTRQKLEKSCAGARLMENEKLPYADENSLETTEKELPPPETKL
ncbi:uncharacterized protein LDX57_008215 [Aspergillus melleus]|uniref:uncharacterized protein n=1 Tax=Aspergillus melleus TaxID=138277 RepID=UPI001E8D59CE|nr:uncharacterized protein LDX57_008215 [Aspergillus melleus]KAH8430551.1 hypothetical protein LDX57_008215 [Aspergillus melleus]